VIAHDVDPIEVFIPLPNAVAVSHHRVYANHKLFPPLLSSSCGCPRFARRSACPTAL
jgi:hypothetical protein